MNSSHNNNSNSSTMTDSNSGKKGHRGWASRTFPPLRSSLRSWETQQRQRPLLLCDLLELTKAHNNSLRCCSKPRELRVFRAPLTFRVALR